MGRKEQLHHSTDWEEAERHLYTNQHATTPLTNTTRYQPLQDAHEVRTVRDSTIPHLQPDDDWEVQGALRMASRI